MPSAGNIEIHGARVHNLHNISVSIPRRTLTVITGVSGSGKSSLAFDTLYAEGQRRYIETFSAYARTFLSGMQRPDVDQISGLTPVIAIEQKTVSRNPRSTVGTITEVYDYLRLLYARAATAYSAATGLPMERHTDDQILQQILQRHSGQPLYILAPIVRGRKGHYRELLDALQRKGFLNARIDGQMRQLEAGMQLDRYRVHNVEVVVDKLIPSPKDTHRLRQSLSRAMKLSDGRLMLLPKGADQPIHYSRRLMCPVSGESLDDPSPGSFSFNSPEGACPHCKGLGVINSIDPQKIITDPKKSIAQGAIAPLGKQTGALIFFEIDALLASLHESIHTPLRFLPEEAIHELINGSDKRLRIPAQLIHAERDHYFRFDGLAHYIAQMADEGASRKAQRWAESFRSLQTCPLCQGKRLRPQSLAFKIAGQDIAQVADLEISQLHTWLSQLPSHLSPRQQDIAAPILGELTKRTDFLLGVGLDYLSLSRPAATLSGGESQRIRLATQLGAQLVNVTYILDEPSIGLHQKDNIQLINSLKALRDLGNTVIVVEHDRDMMLAADYLIDIGPGAGEAGGTVLFQGTPEQILRADTLTAAWLRNEKQLGAPLHLPPLGGRVQNNEDSNSSPLTHHPSPSEGLFIGLSSPPSGGAGGGSLTLTGCTGNNLQHLSVSFPLGRLIGVSGVSGSGKSTLVSDTLLPILSQKLYRSLREPLPYESISGIEQIDKVVAVDQTPIGRSPRSNPATYTGLLTDIRNLFALMPEAQMRGYKPGRFSFNVKGGRCDTCNGNGYQSIAMNFLPGVQVPCPQCHGGRFNRATLEVRFKGKSIADVLAMTIQQAALFFENQPNLHSKLQTLVDVGLGYLTLGQPSNTLSGGESQRVKLAAELSRRDTGRTLYILDEPTTGLHFHDIDLLLRMLRRLVDRGNTVILIEHNLELLACCDYLIDLGPDGGKRGGQVVAAGSPAQIAASGKGYTAQLLRVR